VSPLEVRAAVKAKQNFSSSRPQFLSGWKEIANYLGKGVRTVQRYEREFGLPVRRPAGKPWGSVVATKAELDAWVMASPIREAFHLSRSIATLDNPTAAAIKKGLETMVALRDQMLALRAEVKASVRSLRTSVHDLQGAVNLGRWNEGIPAHEVRDGDSRKSEMFDLTDIQTQQRRAS
jgi:hypothetical protein